MITSILRLDLGSLTMEEGVEQKKLNFIHHLIYLRDSQESESLAGEIFDLQNKYGFPGLASECKGLIKSYGLPDIINGQLNLTKIAWKKSVKSGLMEHSGKAVKEEFGHYSKLKNKNFEN